MRKYLKIFLVFVLLSASSYALWAEEVLTWQECIKEAAKNHPDLIAAGEDIKQSEAGRKITASGLLPQVDSSLSGSTARSDTGKTNSTADSYSYGVTGTQLLFDGNKTVNDLHADSEKITAAKQGFKFTSATVRFRLRTAFIDLLKAQEMLRISEEIYNIRRSNLELITLRYESGLEHKGALLTAEANLAEAKYEISRTQRDAAVAQRELGKELGRAQSVPIHVQGDFAVRDAARDKPDFESIAKGNASLQQLIAQKKAAEFSLKSTYANFSPVLSGQAGAKKSSSYWPPRNDQWNLGISLSMPVFEGGLRFAQVSQAKALLNQLRANERSSKDGVILALEQSWAALQDAIDNLEVQNKSLLAGEERSKIAGAQYSTGFTSFDNWTIIEDNFVRLKKAFLDAQANALFVEADWIHAKGETLEYE
ncbi:MAG: TolC family protein [Candidatus Omnitrophota bacterium]